MLVPAGPVRVLLVGMVLVGMIPVGGVLTVRIAMTVGPVVFTDPGGGSFRILQGSIGLGRPVTRGRLTLVGLVTRMRVVALVTLVALVVAP